MIPSEIDALKLIEDLLQKGYNDNRLEIVCGFSQGYIAAIRDGRVKQMAYQRAARLYNIWCEECGDI